MASSILSPGMPLSRLQRREEVAHLARVMGRPCRANQLRRGRSRPRLPNHLARVGLRDAVRYAGAGKPRESGGSPTSAPRPPGSSESVLILTGTATIDSPYPPDSPPFAIPPRAWWASLPEGPGSLIALTWWATDQAARQGRLVRRARRIPTGETCSSGSETTNSASPIPAAYPLIQGGLVEGD